MKVCPSLEDLALYAGEESVSPSLREHVAHCAECATLVREFEADRVTLQHPPAIPEEVYAAVQRNVLADLPRPSSARRYAWAAAIAAGVAAIAFSPALRREPAAQKTMPAAVAELRTAPHRLEAVKRDPAPRRKARAPRKSPPASLPDAGLIAALDALYETEAPAVVPYDGEVVIAIQTQDPNVTIVLLGDSTGGTE